MDPEDNGKPWWAEAAAPRKKREIMKGLKDKIAVVAGGASGIGAATALRLAEEGAVIAIGDIDGAGAKAIAARIVAKGGRAAGFAFDICDDESVKSFIDGAVAAFGGIDFLHVNAADLAIIFQDTDALTVSLEVVDRTLAVNLRGHLLCTRHALPHLLDRGGGAIVYTTSGAAFAGEPERVAYGMSKSGLNALMRHVASRWGKQGIRANAVAPGLVITEKTRDSMPDSLKEWALKVSRSPRLGEPADIAGMVVYLMSADGEWINGQVISVDGGTLLR